MTLRRALLGLRTWRRTRRVARYEAIHGNSYAYRGVTVTAPNWVSVDLKNALIKDKYESEESGFVAAHLPDNIDVIELGGSIGVVSAFTRSRMAKDAKQIVVEAHPALAQVCATNIAPQDPYGNSKVVHGAVSYANSCEVRFSEGRNQHGGKIGTGGERSLIVPTVRLEQLCEDGEISDFALICDIEGAEIELFAKSDIWKTHCRMIVLETHPDIYASGQTHQNELLARIKAAGFDLLDSAGSVFAFAKA